MSTYVYNADEGALFIADIPIRRGLADGDYLRIEETSDSFSSKAGCDGDVVVSKSNDKRATITIILMQSSPENDVLSNLVRAQKKGQTGAGIGSFLFRDNSGRAKHQATSCWIKKPPTRAYGKEAGTREWVFEVNPLDSFDGGNTQIGA